MSNENTRSILPEGKYKVRALDAAFGEASTGTEQIGVQLELTEGEWKGAMITWYGYFTEATEERTIQSMRYLGWKGVDIMDLSSMFTGQEAQADVRHEEDNDGKIKLKVEWINGIGVVMKKKMEGAQLATFAKRIRGLASRVGGAAANASGSNSGGSLPPRNAGPSRGRDDVPPPSDGDAPPWGGNRGGQSGGRYR